LDYLYATLLGIVQGLTEFLPVSSSAHLILAREFFGWDAQGLGLAFDVATHVGTLAAVLYYFRGDLWPLAAAAPAAMAGRGGDRGHIVRLVVAGTVPIVLVGVFVDFHWLERLREPVVCAATLTFGAILMIIAERARATSRGDRDITTGEAFVIGVGQAAALVPGMSRSGTTISLAMLMGIRREAAARFTFLMSIPAVMAAAAREAVALRNVTLDASAMTMFAVGVVVAGVVGYVSVKYLIRYLANNALDVFAYYRVALAAAVVAWLVARS
jgi:undecaprenyl-diphosphatase